MKILVVDDEKLIVKGIRYNFEQDGHDVICAFDGIEALKLSKDRSIELIILDIMIPKIDGLKVCQKIREYSTVPIIMLTAKTQDMDKIIGLEYGADDYITKPFNILELKARVKAIFRRIGNSQDSKTAAILKVGDVELDYHTRKVHIKGKEIDLTAKEFDLLDIFATSPGRVYSRDNLLDIIWGYDYPGDARTVDVHIRRLREKIEPNPAEPTYVLTKWGVGYNFYQV